ncbi:serine/threonine protein kinase [Candidatus Woesearchaeota archaeon]|nr:serine/threonine protein kinase [Candidatus Woesearchaeota archaeon]
MARITDKAKEKKLSELIIEQGLFFNLQDIIAEYYNTNIFQKKGNVSIFPVGYQSNKVNALLKIIKGKSGDEECQTTYTLFRIIESEYGPEFIVRLHGDKPWKFGSDSGILMKLGDMNLWNWTLQTNPSEKELLKRIEQGAKGVKKAHDLGYRIRDIKPSNFVLFSDLDENCLISLGSGAVKDDTDSEKNSPLFWSPEFWKKKSEGGEGNIYTKEEDIWQFGMTYFMCATRREKGISAVWDKKGGDQVEIAHEEIEKSELSNEAKYYLKNFLSRMDERYPDLEMFINEAEQKKRIFIPDRTKEKIEDPETKLEYERFLKTNEELIEAMTKGRDNRTDNDYGAINHESIADIVEGRIALMDIANKDNITIIPDASETAHQTTLEYNEVLNNEREILLEVMQEIEKDTQNGDMEMIISIQEKIFLWGPPFTYADRSKRKSGGKARYTLAETIAKKTHYHK